MEIKKKDSYLKGFKSLLISIPLAILTSVIFLMIAANGTKTDVGMGLGQVYAGLALVYISIIIFFGVMLVVSLFYIVLYARKKQTKALKVAVIVFFVIIAFFLIVWQCFIL